MGHTCMTFLIINYGVNYRIWTNETLHGGASSSPIAPPTCEIFRSKIIP